MADNYFGGIRAGATSVSLEILLRKKTDNTELTGIVYNTSGNVASYRRQGAARVAITMATQTVTGGYSSGGFVEIDATNLPGLYRLDVPNAAFAAGVDYVDVAVKTTDGYLFVERIPLAMGDAILVGTAQGGSASTIQLASATSVADDLPIGATVVITGGTGFGQSGRIITDWVSSTDTATVSPDWASNPDSSTTYRVIPTPPAPTVSTALPAVNVERWKGSAAPAMTGDAYAAVGALDALDAAGVRAAVGLDAADLDDQLAALPTAAENAAEMLSAADAAPIAADIRKVNTIAIASA